MVSKRLENMNKAKEELIKKITELEQKEKQKQEEKEQEEKRKQENIKARILAKRISISHLEMNNKFMKDIFAAINDIQNEALFSMKKNKIEYIGVDPAHVALYQITIPEKALNKYVCKKEHDIGLQVDEILKILKRRKQNTTIISMDDYQEDTHFYITWETGYGKFKRIIGLVDTAGIPTSKKPELNLPVEFTVDILGIIEFLKECDDVSDHFSITTDEIGVIFEAEGDEDIIRYVISGKKFKTYKSLFSLDYFMNAIISMKPFFKQLILKIGNDNPIEIKGRNKDGFEMMVLLAPRIESE